MIIFARQFAPPLWGLLLTLVGMSVFIGLGVWQLERAVLKESIEAKFESRLAADYRHFQPSDSIDDIEYRKLLVKGRYDNQHNFLIDNQINRGRAGYQVLTPLLLQGSDAIMLVNRGWVALGESRQQLPDILPPSDSTLVYGIATLPVAEGFRMGETRLGESWPQVIPYVDMLALQAQYSSRLLPVVLWLGAEQEGQYLREWDPVWSDPEKSRAYALQWFSFAAIAFILLIVLNLRKVK